MGPDDIEPRERGNFIKEAYGFLSEEQDKGRCLIGDGITGKLINAGHAVIVLSFRF